MNAGSFDGAPSPVTRQIPKRVTMQGVVASEGQPTSPGDLIPTFIQDLLKELRGGGYTLEAWLRFFNRSWQRSLADVRRSPALSASLVRQSTLLETLALAVVTPRAATRSRSAAT